MNQKEVEKFYDLVTASVEGVISPEQFEILRESLRQDQEAVQYYADYISMLSILRSGELLKDLVSPEESILDTGAMA